MVTTRADFWSGTTAWARRFKSPPLRVPAHRERRRGGPARSDGGGARVGERRRLFLRGAVGGRARDRPRGNRIELTLREWVNSGLMTFFFFLLGLEARREFDLGDFRERRRFVLPLLASVGGMGAAAAIYLAFNLASSAAEGWGIAMSSDTAFALGSLTLFGRLAPDRLRAFMLTVLIADDLLALVVIALVYSGSIDVMPLIWAAGVFAVALVLLLGFKLRRGPPYFVLGSAMWVVALESGIEPLVVGLACGLLVWPRPPPARTSSTQESASVSSASSRRRSSSAWPARASGPRSRPTSACSSSITRGRATWSSRCSRWPSRASRSTATSSSGPRARRSRRLRRREAPRPPRQGAARHLAVTRATATHGRLGRGRERERERGRRLHRLAARRHAGLRRRTARGGQGRHPRRPRRRG